MVSKLILAGLLIAAPCYAANGDVVDSASPYGGFVRRFLMLDAVGAAADAEWVDIGFARGKKTCHITGLGTGTVQIRASNASAEPANSADGVLLGVGITAESIVTFEDNVRWFKVEKTASGDSTASTAVCTASSGF